MEHKKLMKTAALIDRVLRVLQVVLLAAGVLLLAAAVCMVVFRDVIAAHAEEITDSISFGALSLTTAHGAALTDPALLVKSQMVTSAFFLLLVGIVWCGVRLLRQILKSMKAGEPFTAGISAAIRQLAWFVVLLGIVEQVFTAIASSMLFRAYNMTRLLNMQVVNSYTLSRHFSLDFVAVAALLFLLAYVFRYGEELQRESDETL